MTKQERLLAIFKQISATEIKRADLKRKAAVHLKYNEFFELGETAQELYYWDGKLNNLKAEHSKLLYSGENHEHI